MTARLKLGQLLVAEGLIHPDQLAAALATQQESTGGRLGAALIAMGAIEEEQLLRVLAEQLGVPVARIGGRTVSAEIIDLVPGDAAEKHRCLPLFLRDGEDGDVLVLGMEDPSDADALADVQRHVRCELRPVLIAPTELDAALDRYHRSVVPNAFEGLTGLADAAPPVAESSAPADPGETVPEASPLPPTDLMDLPDDLSWSEPADDPGLDDDSLAGEDPFADFEKEPFAADARPAAQAEATDPVGVDAGADPPAAAARQDAILQALAQLLVEKGVITRQEFAARLRQLSHPSD